MLIENLNSVRKPEETVDLKKIFFLMVRQWQWFLLFGLMGFATAFLYTKTTKPIYEVSTSVLVPEKSPGMDMKSVFEKVLDQQGNNIYNQMEIIKSYYPINKTLINLNWRTSWYKENLFMWKGIYGQEPYEVIEGPGAKNLEGIVLSISPITDEEFNIVAHGETNIDGVKQTVEFDGKGFVNRPFVNDYFNFTLLKKGTNNKIEKGSYRFVFNNLNNATLGYQSRLNVALKVKKSDLIQCSVQGDEPEKEGAFLNELVKVYIDNKVELQNGALRKSLQFINEQLEGITDSMTVASSQFSAFRTTNKIIDLGQQGTLVMTNLKEIESEKAKSQMQLDYFNSLRTYLSNPTNGGQLVSPSVVGIQDASLNVLVLRIGELYSRRQILSFSAKDNNPTVSLLDKEMSQTRTLINENLRNLIDNATQSIRSLTERQNKITAELNLLPEKEQKLINIQRQFDLTNEIYTFLLQKRAETNIALASSISDVQVIEVARPANAVPKGLSKRNILIIGFILGIGLPLTVIVLINVLDDRIRSQEDIENNTKIPIVGTILHDISSSVVTVSDSPKSIISESFRALRTNMQFMLPGQGCKVIAIQSTNPSEGKSFISLNLASILAMNNKKVLLIGADMRKPKLHKTFNLKNDHGLSTFLIGYDQMEEAIFPTTIKNLSLMPSGPIPPNPAEILEKPEMKQLIEKLRESYDYVVIDNAPISMVTDGIIVSQLSDLNIFIVRYGYSHKHQIEIINNYTEKKMVNHGAIVVNGIKSNAFGYSFSKYSRYEAYHKYQYKYNYYATDDQA